MAVDVLKKFQPDVEPVSSALVHPVRALDENVPFVMTDVEASRVASASSIQTRRLVEVSSISAVSVAE